MNVHRAHLVRTFVNIECGMAVKFVSWRIRHQELDGSRAEIMTFYRFMAGKLKHNAPGMILPLRVIGEAGD